MAKKKIKEIIEEIAAGFMEESELELYNVEFAKEGRDWFLRVYIDKISAEEEEYVSTDDCEKVSRFLSDELDRLDPIEQNYYLEVSSPGAERPLKKEKDYERALNSYINVSLYQQLDGKKVYEGTMTALSKDELTLEYMDKTRKKTITIPRKQIAKARLAIKF